MGSKAKAPFGGSVRLVGVAVAALAVALLGALSAPALAAPGHSAIDTFSTGVGTAPGAVATDADGNFYVFDTSRMVLAKYDSSGSPAAFSATASYVAGNQLLGTAEGRFASAPGRSGVAVDSSGGPNDGNIYLAQEGSTAAAFIYSASGAYLGSLGQFGCGAVAVNPANGSVYVAEGSFSEAFIGSYGVPSGNPQNQSPIEKLRARSECTVAIDSAGAAYVGGPIFFPNGPNFPQTTAEGRKFDASQFGVASPVQAFGLDEPVLGPSALGMGVDPVDGSVYFRRSSGVKKFDAAGVLQGADFGPQSETTGLAVDASRNVWITNAGGGVFVFAPNTVQLPVGSTGGSAGVTSTAATLEGSVDPDGAGGITGCEFRYGEDSGYAEGAVPCVPAASSGTPIAAPTSVSANLTGLVSGATYHYRLFLTNANGTQMATGDQTLTTPAATEGVSTEQATGVGKDSAVLNGSYVGDGQDLHYFFEWGRTTAYGQTTPAPPGGDAGTGSGPQGVAPVQISGLEGGTTYHYRLVVSTASGITRGQDATLTTTAAVTNLTADPVTALTNASAELHGSFDRDSNATTYHYEWGPTSEYGNVAPGGTIPPGAGRVDLPGATLTGLGAGSTYHYRVVASNATGTTKSADATFRTAEAPILTGLNSRNLQASSAELVGEVNPRRGDTHYRFEWGPTSAYGQVTPVPDGDLGSGDAFVPVNAAIDGLQAGVTYHFRLVASNPYGTTASPDQTFGFYPPNCPNAQLRQETKSNTLPDCRAYELVTPSFGQGAVISPVAGPPLPPFATSPSRIAFAVAFGAFTEESGEPINVVGDPYVSTRRDTGWTQRLTALPAPESQWQTGRPPVNQEEDILVQGFSLGRSQLRTQASPSLDRVINYTRGWPVNGGSVIVGKASNAPYVWNTSTGALIERWPSTLTSSSEGFVGSPEASADFSHFVFQSNIAFAPDGTEVPRSIECCFAYESMPQKPAESIYDNDVKTGEVKLASYKTGDQETFEGYVYNVSEDGSRILMATEWLSPANSLLPPNVSKYADIQGPLYLRSDANRTYEIAAGHVITYVGSTSDGKNVYLTSKEPLTPDDQDNSTDLFVWRESDQEFERLSVGSFGNAGNSDQCGGATWNGGGCSIEPIEFAKYAGLYSYGLNFQGGQGGNGATDTAIASENGDIYFISPEQLVEGKGEKGKANLYLHRQGSIRFVATMDPSPLCTTTRFDGSCATGSVARMQVTPDGDHMAFVVGSNITGYDSHGQAEMYLYDPDSGRLSCASCRPDTVPPVSDTYASLNGLFLTYDGRAFFSTEDPLVVRDTNEVQDVYEYTEGRAQLISSGTGTDLKTYAGYASSASATGLVSVSANGVDVYFGTLDSLVTQDHNGAVLKIYDARVGGGFPAERTLPNCEAADECHGPGAGPPAPPPNRTTANLGKKAKPKAHKPKKHKAKKHKAKKHKKKKARTKGKSSGAGVKQGRGNRG